MRTCSGTCIDGLGVNGQPGQLYLELGYVHLYP